MRVYLAASINAKTLMKEWRDTLMQRGHYVTSRWLDVNVKGPTPEQARMFAQQDLDDIAKSDGMIAYIGEPSTSGGFHLEMGFYLGRRYALATAFPTAPYQKMLVVGQKSSVFHHLPEMAFFDSLELALSYDEWWAT